MHVKVKHGSYLLGPGADCCERNGSVFEQYKSSCLYADRRFKLLSDCGCGCPHLFSLFFLLHYGVSAGREGYMLWVCIGYIIVTLYYFDHCNAMFGACCAWLTRWWSWPEGSLLAEASTPVTSVQTWSWWSMLWWHQDLTILMHYL